MKTTEPYSYHLVEETEDLSDDQLKKVVLRVFIKLAQLIHVEKMDRKRIIIYCHPRFRKDLNISDCKYQPVTSEIIAVISKN